MLLVPLIFGVLLFSNASGLKNCNDCSIITQCEPALQLVLHDKGPETVALLNRALCGYEELPKVCCSEFVNSRSASGLSVEETNGDEIENHPNINLLSNECGDIEGNRIVGGDAASLYEFPWLVLISHRTGRSLKFNCGGTLISSRYVLTAAHCIKGKKIAGVRVGEYDISRKIDCTGIGSSLICESYQDIAVINSVYHQDYVRIPVVLNDIGLLRLRKLVDFSYRNAGAICLPVLKEIREMDLYGAKATVAGWGVTESGQSSNIPRKVELPIYSPSACNDYYNKNSKEKPAHVLTNKLCAGELGRDSCKGDSGGPFMLEGSYNNTYKFIQFGIVSYGPAQCGSYTPGIYTDVRNFMMWILDNLKP